MDDVRLRTDKSFADLTLPVTMKVKTNLKNPAKCIPISATAFAFAIASHSTPSGDVSELGVFTKEVANVGIEPVA